MADIVKDDIGGCLRNARERLGMSLSDAARRTRLSVAVLQAIERNDFNSLPGGMYRKAYLRTLAAEVGLDAHDIVAHYAEIFEPPIETHPVAAGDAAREKEWVQQLAPSPRRSIVTLAALGTLAAAWFILQPGPVAPAVPGDDPLNEFAAVPMRGNPSIALASGPADPAAAPLRIEMAVSGWCWVAAESDGERVFYRLVEPGERLVLEGQHTISLRLGDAGAVMLSINEGPQRTLGRDGEVAELEITPENVDDLRDGVEAMADAAAPIV